MPVLRLYYCHTLKEENGTFVTVADRPIPYVHRKEPTLAIAHEDLAGMTVYQE